MFILDSNRYARDPGGVTSQLSRTVEKHGGEMLASRLWSEQKLAYPIAGHRKGTYWLTYFRIDSRKQKELLREYRLNEAILRNLILSVDDRLVETLVQHATAGSASAARPAPETEAAPARPRTSRVRGRTRCCSTPAEPRACRRGCCGSRTR